jgi:hypothetical protein
MKCKSMDYWLEHYAQCLSSIGEIGKCHTMGVERFHYGWSKTWRHDDICTATTTTTTKATNDVD